MKLTIIPATVGISPYRPYREYLIDLSQLTAEIVFSADTSTDQRVQVEGRLVEITRRVLADNPPCKLVKVSASGLRCYGNFDLLDQYAPGLDGSIVELLESYLGEPIEVTIEADPSIQTTKVG